MTPATLPRNSSSQWQALRDHSAWMRGQTLRHLFAQDSHRGRRFGMTAAGLYLDCAKQRVTTQTLRLLYDLAETCDIRARITALFSGACVNRSEARPALHTALRAPPGDTLMLDGQDIVPQIQATLAQMTRFCEQVRNGQHLGQTGRRIRNIVNIGTGGSHLGPAMACRALHAYGSPELQVRFVSNVDASDLAAATAGLDAAETLFIVCSKSFATQETLINARTARHWCLTQLGDEQALSRHFVAVTARPDRALEFGLASEQVFPMWDWVGGRYSLGSAAGLALMLSIGPTHFRDLLAGSHAMDRHFRQAPPEQNLPLTMGLLGVWNSSFLGSTSVAVLPYAEALALLPAYLQQLTMESNGKSVTQDGRPIDYPTGPIYWGQVGTNGQHSFHQLLHQGRHDVSCDFIGFASPQEGTTGPHDVLLAHMMAQSRALAFGQQADDLHTRGIPQAEWPHHLCVGDHPSTTVLASRLTPHVLGALIALYEHSVFTQSVIWDINPFDQWGVELGKRLAQEILDAMPAGDAPALDSSTRELLQQCRTYRQAGSSAANDASGIGTFDYNV